MATQVQRRKGTTAQHSTFTGASAELTVDTTKNTVVVHDGVTAGGIPLAKENNATLTGAVTLSGGTANGVAYLNGSKVLTTGSALTFDGTNLFRLFASTPVFRLTPSVNTELHGIEFGSAVTDAFIKQQPNTAEFRLGSGRSAGWGGFTSFYIDTAEKMRLTSTGLGIGTSLPGAKLQVTNGTAGRSSYSSDADDIVIDSTGSGSGMTIASDRASYGVIYFADQDSGTRGIFRYDHVDNSLRLGTDGSERLRITSSGNVGIGMSSPSARLHVSDSDANAVALFERITSGSSSPVVASRSVAKTSVNAVDGFGSLHAFSMQDDTSGRQNLGYIGAVRSGADDTGSIVLSPVAGGASIERMRIDSSGNVGISTNSPQYKLTVNGIVQATNSAATTIAAGATTTVITPPRGFSYINISRSDTASYGLLLLVFRTSSTLEIVSTVSDKSNEYSASVSGTALQVTNSSVSSRAFYASCVCIAFGTGD